MAIVNVVFGDAPFLTLSLNQDMLLFLCWNFFIFYLLICISLLSSGHRSWEWCIINMINMCVRL